MLITPRWTRLPPMAIGISRSAGLSRISTAAKKTVHIDMDYFAHYDHHTCIYIQYIKV